MKSIVLLPGRPPAWVQQHARHIAQRLSERGRVMLVQLHQSPNGRLPGELQPSAVLGTAPSGYPIWTGGLPAALGVRRRHDVAVMVLWQGANPRLAVLAALASRARSERLVLNMPVASHEARAGVAKRLLERLAFSVIQHEPTGEAPSRMVLAVCGHDAVLAQTVIAAFDGLAADAVAGWTLEVAVDASVDRILHRGVRYPDRVTIRIARPADVRCQGAAVVIAPHGSPWASIASQAVDAGAAGVLVGHPIAGRIGRQGDGVLLASTDPSAVLVAMESATGAKDRCVVSIADLKASSDLVVASAHAFA